MGVMPNDDARKNSGLTSEQVPLIHVHQSVWWLVVVWAKKIAVAKWEKTAFETVWIFNQIPSYIVILLILVEKCLMIFHTVHFFTLGHHIHLYLLYFKKKHLLNRKMFQCSLILPPIKSIINISTSTISLRAFSKRSNHK